MTNVNSGVIAGGQREGQLPHPPLNFSLLENVLVGKFSSKNTKFGAKIFILGAFRDEIALLSTHRLLCEKFQAVCQKISTSCSPLPYFFNPQCR